MSFTDNPHADNTVYIQSVEELRSLALQGDASAQYNLGLYYANGTGVERDYVEAVRWFRMAAVQGHAGAQYCLGLSYAHGNGVDSDAEEAVRWFTMAAESEHTEAQYKLGMCYLSGIGVKPNYELGITLMRKAATKNHSDAALNVGICYYKGFGVEIDKSEAIKWLRKAKTLGAPYAHELLNELGYSDEADADEDLGYDLSLITEEAQALYNTGVQYYIGRDAPQDYEMALVWFRDAARHNHPSAMYDIEICYFKGQGVEQNYPEAIKWWRMAADYGHKNAMYGLGICYQSGRGAAIDYEEAAKWYRMAVERGHEKAKEQLQRMPSVVVESAPRGEEKNKSGEEDVEEIMRMAAKYHEGDGVVRDINRALHLYVKAATMGEGKAQLNAAIIYYSTGQYGEALRWFMALAEMEKPPVAHYCVGMFYHRGLAVQKSYSEAARWYRKAAAQGNRDAINALFTLGERWKG